MPGFVRKGLQTISPMKDAPLIELSFKDGGTPPDAGAVKKLRETMTNLVGVVREAKG